MIPQPLPEGNAPQADHALIVRAGLANGRTRRHVFFSLPSAQAAIDRTRARGLEATLHLVRLVPVPLVSLEELGDEL